jgi:uncharacterized protein YutE (UPF0331/DUF86 family)
MMSDLAREHLIDTWQTCQHAVKWLERSYDKSPSPPYENVGADDWDQLEALSGRFGRLTDLVLHKVLRAIDRYELEETGSLLDSSNRAVKRGLINSIDVLRDLKDLRNEIVHEYAIDDLNGLYEDIYAVTPALLKLVAGIREYLAEKHELTL